MQIRLVAHPGKLTEHVRHQLNVLDAECFPEDPLYQKDNCYWWIVTNDNGPVAFAGLKPLTGYNEGLAFLCRAGVSPAARGQRLQRRLIRARIRYAQKRGFKSVVTYAHNLNFRSAVNLLREGLNFYEPIQSWGVEGALYFIMEFSK